MFDSSKLVAHQLRLVEIKRELERSRPSIATIATTEEVRAGPCILFSRECGSAGDAVANAVGERLQWQVFNRELVEEIAKLAHVRDQLVESVDEHVRSNWRRMLDPIRRREGLSPDVYLFYLHEIVLSLGHHGYVVIVGRGAQFLLPSECAVRVRVVEPLSSRVQRISSTRQLSLEEAAHFVRKREADRTEFIRRVFHQDTTSSLNYDLVLNTGLMSIECATVVVLRAFQEKLGARAEAIPCKTSFGT